MGILFGINESKGGRSALTKQNALTSLLGQRTGEGIPVGQTSKSLLQESGEFIDVEGLPLFSQ
jgi:hypothetical protein